MKRLLRALDPLVAGRLGETLAVGALRLWASAVARGDPATALRRLLRVNDGLLGRIDLLAIELDRGIHAKHRLISYHDFFVERVRPGERVLDAGCGKGELAHDLAERARANVTGVDVNPAALAFARRRFQSPRLRFVEADVRRYADGDRFDVVVLSNVLEHLDDRPALLRRLLGTARPDRFLIRVPVLERDWLVALRRELGLPFYSDPTHETEYDGKSLRAEVREAGLELSELHQRWGELWAVAVPSAAAGGGDAAGAAAILDAP